MLYMPKFAVIVQGRNYVIKDMPSSKAGLKGFYVMAFVEVASEGTAAEIAIECVRDQLKSKIVANIANSPPCLMVDEVACLSDWPKGCIRPLTGFAFYDEVNESE